MIDDDISKLIKEAKPLYFARKRRHRIIKSTLGVVICAIGLHMYIPSPNYLYNYDGLAKEIYLTETGSIIEDIGLPVDEYGFLKVV